jgi:hypothetical protein
MDSLTKILMSIDGSLKSIAKSLEKISNSGLDELDKEPIQGDEINPNHKESVLFEKIMGVYMNEERERLRSGKNKKSARRISVNLGETIADYFLEELSIPHLKVERSKVGGLIVFSQNDTPFAVLKFMTDLGYARSEQFYEVVQETQIMAEEEFGVDKENVFFLISSLYNGIEKAYVEKLIGEELSSNTDFLKNKSQVQLFLYNYINGVHYFKNPSANIYFMASELHPNNLANDVLQDLDYGNGNYYEVYHNVNVYNWFCSIESLFDEISNLAEKYEIKLVD